MHQKYKSEIYEQKLYLYLNYEIKRENCLYLNCKIKHENRIGF